MTTNNPFKYFKTSPEIIRLAVMYHAQIYNHFNHERHLETRQSFKQKRATALTERFNFCAAWCWCWCTFSGVLKFVQQHRHNNLHFEIRLYRTLFVL